MNRRPHALFLLVFLALAPSSLARVLSYSPYTNRAATLAFQPRIADHFVLVEQPGTEFLSAGWMDDAEVVMYEASGSGASRVVFPPAGQPRATIIFAAYAPVPGSHVPASRMLIQTRADFEGKNPGHQTITLISDIAIEHWKRIPELDNAVTYITDYEDLGGYTTRGLAGPVRVVSGSKYVFVVALNTGIWGIEPSGKATLLVPGQAPYGTSIIGSDLTSSKLLLRTYLDRIVVLEVSTGAQTDLGLAEGYSQGQGWVTGDGQAYVLLQGGDGRYLKHYRKGMPPAIVATAYFNPVGSSDPSRFFAAPTHDYNGAWIIQRDIGRPTTLLRHTASEGLKTFWSDITGPQVEALHPGLTGERLLIQVHRARVQPERWFIDPALAIWKIGDPAPRDYHELFLNETALKGFVHLDVDAVAEGHPFIFDSGMGTMPVSRTSPPISGGGDVIQEWGVVRSSFKQQLVLPGVARLPGAFNSYWQSDVIVYNPTDAGQEVTFKFSNLYDSSEIEGLATKSITLAPREIRVIKDVLHELFGLETGGGSLHIEPSVGVSATGRTYTSAGQSTSAGQGTFGFSMIALDAFTGAGSRFPLSFAGAFPGSNFRTNILLTAPRGAIAGARLQAHGVSGTIGSSDVTLNTSSSGVLQTNNLDSVLRLASHEEGGLVVRPTHGFIIPAVVAIDNITNDPTYFPPDLPAPLVRTIPVVGHVDGANNSKFRSDIYLLNLSTTLQTVTLEAKQWDTNTPPKQVQFTLLPNEDRVIRDVLPKLFNMTGFARLRYQSFGGDGEGVRVTSRTYNLLENGGTLGCLIPPLNSFQSAASGESLEILGVVGGDGFRANIGLVELSPFAGNLTTNVRIEIVDDHGVTIDSFQVTLPAAGGMQINNIFASRGVTAPKAALIRIKPNGPGLIGAYATLTDNITNDPSFLAANLAATE
jgi:hypothetical protein